jgi:O-antigen biosynthesis protein
MNVGEGAPDRLRWRQFSMCDGGGFGRTGGNVSQRGYPAAWNAIIVNYNGGLFLEPCLRSLTNGQVPPARIIVVDNASTDDSILELAPWPNVEVLQLPENRGYAGGANHGVRASDAPIVVLLNPDVELDSAYGAEVIRLFDSNPGLGAAGALLRFPQSDLLQHAGGVVEWPVLTTSHLGEGVSVSTWDAQARDVDYATGAALAVRREAFDRISGFDEAFFPAYWEDVDFCYRLRSAGWNVRIEPPLSGIHHEGAGEARGADYFRTWTRNRLRFAMKHLSQSQLSTEFIPAELDRLRGEVSAIESIEWFVRSGGSAIESWARTELDERSGLEAGFAPRPIVDAAATIAELAALADPAPPELRPSDGVVSRMKRFLSRFSGRLYAEELYWRQRIFNESLVRALEAQDRLNREQTVQLIYAMLLIGYAKSTFDGRHQDESNVTRSRDQKGRS